MRRFIILAITLGGLVARDAAAAVPVGGENGVQMSGEVALLFRQLDRHTTLNANFHGDDAFNAVRAKVFLLRDWTPKIKMNTEFLWDNGMAAPRVQGAYLTFLQFLGPISAKAGLIGYPYGNFAYRSTYFNMNPVVGTPAMWNYHTPLPGDGNIDNATIIAKKSRVGKGVPAAYDVCWSPGVELFTQMGYFEGSFGLSEGALSNPQAQANNGYQKLVRLGLAPNPDLRFGLSGALGRWLKPDPAIIFEHSATHYDQYAAGYYLEYCVGHWEFYSEAIWTSWEAPLIHEENLPMVSGYLDVRWDFAPAWYLGARYDNQQYGKIAVNNDGTGPTETWSINFDRKEIALAYRLLREAFIRLDYQRTDFAEGQKPIQIAALQFQFVF